MNAVAQEKTTTPARPSHEMVRAVESSIIVGDAQRAMFLPANMGEAMEMATLMAASNFVPKHLRQRPGDCLAVIMQASRWGMDPYAVGNKTYFVNDRMAFEAQLVAAVVNSSNVLDGRLNYEWVGSGESLKCKVSGKIKGDAEIKEREVSLDKITTRNSPLWKQDPQQQLGYFAGRAWARLHTPEVLMGVYTTDEVKEIPAETEAAPRLTRTALANHADGIDDVVDAEIEVVAEPEQGRTDEQHGDQFDGDETDPEPAWQPMVTDWHERIDQAESATTIIAVRSELSQHRDALPDDVVADLDKALFDGATKFTIGE